MPPLTVVLTNWKRADNLRRVIDALDRQTLRPVMFLWNNGTPFDDPRVDWRVDSSTNQRCWPRWFMAARAQTEFVAVLDDDLMPQDERVLENAVGFLSHQPTSSAIGVCGVNLIDDRPYGKCGTVWPSETDQSVDIVKGRFLMTRTASLRAIPFAPATDEGIGIADDIIISAQLADGRSASHWIPSILKDRFAELPQPHALSGESGHYTIREAVRREQFIAKRYRNFFHQLCEQHGSDKGKHGYDIQYTRLFENRRHENLRILEIGVGQGSSVRVWCEYFPNADIFMIDTNETHRRRAGDRVRIFIGDQANRDFLRHVVAATGAQYDLIVDDGGHQMHQQQTSFAELFPTVVPNGVYVVEDLETSSNPQRFNPTNQTTTVDFLMNIVGRNSSVPLGVRTDAFVFQSNGCFIVKSK